MGMDRGPPMGVPYPQSRKAIYKTRVRRVERLKRSNVVHRCWIGAKRGEMSENSAEAGGTAVKRLSRSSVGVSGCEGGA